MAGSLAWHCCLTRAGMSTEGMRLGKVSGHSGCAQVQGAGDSKSLKVSGKSTGIIRQESVVILENVVMSYLHISGYPLPVKGVVQQMFVSNAVHPLLLCDLSHNSHVCQEERYVFQWRCYLSMQHWWTKDQVQFTSAPLS